MTDVSTEPTSDESDEPPVDASSLSADETNLLLSFLPVSALKEAGSVSAAWRAAAVESWQTHLRERFGVRATGPAAIRSYATHSAQALGKSWLTAVRVADRHWHLNMRTNVSACVDAASGTAMLVTPYNAAVVPLPRASFERVTHAVSTVHELPAPESVECMAARACGAAWTTSRGEVSVLCGWPGGETTRRWSAELLAPEESRAALAPLAVDLAPGDGVVPVVGLNVADAFRLYRCEGDAERPDPALSLQLRDGRLITAVGASQTDASRWLVGCEGGHVQYIDATAGKALPLFTSCSCKPSRLRILTETLLGGARSHGNSRGSGHGNVVTLWDARTLDRVDELWPVGVGKGGGGDGTVVGFSLSANLLVAATRSNFLCAWDARVWGKVLWSRMMDRQQLSGQVMDRATPSDVHAAGEWTVVSRRAVNALPSAYVLTSRIDRGLGGGFAWHENDTSQLRLRDAMNTLYEPLG